MITYGHTASTFLIWTVILSAILVCAFSYWRFVEKDIKTHAIMLLRILFFLLLTWCMLQPEMRNSLTHMLKPRFVVAMDASKSMLLSPSDDVSNRWSVANDVVKMPWTKYVGSECKIDAYTFASELSSKIELSEISKSTPSGTSTLLRNAMQKIAGTYGGQNVAGMVLLSDGIDTREAYDDWVTESWPIPIYTVLLEPGTGWKKEPDVRIDSANTLRRVTVGWKTDLKVAVSGQGTKGQAQSIKLFENGTLIQELPFQIPANGGSQEIQFPLEHPEIGIFRYKVYVPPLKGETHKDDNEYELTVQVIDAKNRLLYVEGPPRWESKYVIRALKADKEIESVSFVRGPGGKFMTYGTIGSMTPDMREDQLTFFKIVMLGNLDAGELGTQRAQNLVKFVEAGGSLIILGGPEAWGSNGYMMTPLKKILPIKKVTSKTIEGTYSVALTALGRNHPAFAGDPELWNDIPPILSVFPNAALSPAAQALVAANTPDGIQPFIITQPYGQGKVTLILTDSLWKWVLNDQVSDKKPYQRFWTQLLSWMIPKKEKANKKAIEIFADREQLYLGEQIKLSARITNDKDDKDNTLVKCEITDPDQRTIPFTMNKEYVLNATGSSFPGYVVKFTSEKAGLHTAVATVKVGGNLVKSDPVSFFVKPFTPESVPRVSNIDVLKALASNSGGQYFDNIDALNDKLQTLNFQSIEEESVEYNSLWEHWYIITILILLLSAEWILRKMKNMP